jgi:hypothetical protein
MVMISLHIGHNGAWLDADLYSIFDYSARCITYGYPLPTRPGVLGDLLSGPGSLYMVWL